MLSPDRHSCSLLSDTVYLRDKEHESLTGFRVDQSHSPGDVASGITPDKKPYAHGSSVIGQRIVPRVFPDPPGVTEGCLSHTTDLYVLWPSLLHRPHSPSSFIPRPSTSASIHDLFDQDVRVDEPIRRHSGIPYFNPFDDEVSTPIISHIPDIPDLPLSLDNLPLPLAYSSELSFIGSEFPATSRTHGLTTSSSQDAATPSSSSALAYSGFHTSWLDDSLLGDASRLDDSVACQWVDHTGTCDQLINRKNVAFHLRASHRIKSGSQDHITCLWGGCSREMQHRALARHVTERHLGQSRTSTKHSRGK